MLIEEKVENFFEDLKKHSEESEGVSFNASHSWFHQFIARVNLEDIKVTR